MLPKSILKKTKQAFAEPPPEKTALDRHREIAIHHATLIQQQKDVESDILQATIDLLDLPLNEAADPAHPSGEDADLFCKLIIPFQPSDYDALIEERHAADKCGYTLCPKPPQKSRIRGRLCLVDTADNGVQVVSRNKVEIWCSHDCARRALYVKVQLNEEPAWLRRGAADAKIDLLIGSSTELTNEPPKDASASQEAELQQKMAELALERGEKGSTIKMEGLVTDMVQEKKTSGTVAPPTLVNSGADDKGHGSIEGYIPKGQRRTKTSGDDDDDDDWDIRDLVE